MQACLKYFLAFFILFSFFSKTNLKASSDLSAEREISLKDSVGGEKKIQKNFSLLPSSGGFLKTFLFYQFLLSQMNFVFAFDMSQVAVVENEYLSSDLLHSEQNAFFDEDQTSLLASKNSIFDFEKRLDSKDQDIRNLNIYAPDDRVVAEEKYPEKTVGLLSFQQDSSWYQCTATLISKKHILTNSHCVFAEGENFGEEKMLKESWKKSFRFYPNYRSTHEHKPYSSWKRLYYPKAYQKNEKQKDKQENDWAIIELADEMGKDFSWMKIMGLNYKDYQLDPSLQQVNLVAYSGDLYSRLPGAHYNCSIRAVMNIYAGQGQFYMQLAHDCDSTRGSSGGSLYSYKDGEPHIIALHHAAFFKGETDHTALEEYSHSYANLAIKTWDIAETLSYIEKDSAKEKLPNAPGKDSPDFPQNKSEDKLPGNHTDKIEREGEGEDDGEGRDETVRLALIAGGSVLGVSFLFCLCKKGLAGRLSQLWQRDSLETVTRSSDGQAVELSEVVTAL